MQETTFFAILLIVVCAFVPDKAHHAYASDSTYSIKGSITLQGVGVEGALVHVGEYRVPTGKYGMFMIQDIPSGTYTVTPKLSGHRFHPPFITLNTSEIDGRDISFRAELPTGKGPWSGTVAMDVVHLPAGTFTMGASHQERSYSLDEKVLREIYLDSFAITAYEITFEQYDTFCEATGREKPRDDGLGRGKRPVVNVSWFDAVAFAEWVGGRLPTEAEWEYACRAGTTTAFFTGNNIDETQANFFSSAPITVGSFSPNRWGLYDMHGNVWEWCSDWYGAYNKEQNNNPKGQLEGYSRVVRGGSWANSIAHCRSSYRHSEDPLRKNTNIGFRIVFSSSR